MAIATPAPTAAQVSALSPAIHDKLAKETDARFAAQTGVSRKLDPSKPLDQKLIPVWLQIEGLVYSQILNGTVVYTFDHPVVTTALADAAVSSAAAATSMHAAATAPTIADAHAHLADASAHAADASAHAAKAAAVQPPSVDHALLSSAASKVRDFVAGVGSSLSSDVHAAEHAIDHALAQAHHDAQPGSQPGSQPTGAQSPPILPAGFPHGHHPLHDQPTQQPLGPQVVVEMPPVPGLTVGADDAVTALQANVAPDHAAAAGAALPVSTTPVPPSRGQSLPAPHGPSTHVAALIFGGAILATAGAFMGLSKMDKGASSHRHNRKRR